MYCVCDPCLVLCPFPLSVPPNGSFYSKIIIITNIIVIHILYSESMSSNVASRSKTNNKKQQQEHNCNKNDTKWLARYAQLKEYWKMHGNCKLQYYPLFVIRFSVIFSSIVVI